MDVLVTGGSGFVGQHLVGALLRRGHRVAMLGRDWSRAAATLAAGAIPISADLRDRAAIVAACAGRDAVFHVGALSAPWGRAADFHAVNVGGTENVLAGCERHGVGRLVAVSSPSVLFDGRDQHLLTDAAPYPARFVSAYSLTKKLAEDRVRAAGERGLAAVILRPKAIFGPGDTTLLPRLVAAARRGRLPQIGAGRNLVDLTYVGNVVHALLLALEAPAAVGNTYAITNDEHPALWEVIRAVLGRLGIPSALRRVPLGAALAAARLMEWRAAVTGREPLLTRYSVAILARTQTYDIAAARRDLGYAPPIPLAAGIERTLEAMR
ncbi:MAG TPA: NAD-dependent epimerase/dehydratase family protein [Herpetosiphonaceae bacterium]|nr:NAD-dependent epimerase/dehydratase family protein [Herpetosiphonaceae bacterium]